MLKGVLATGKTFTAIPSEDFILFELAMSFAMVDTKSCANSPTEAIQPFGWVKIKGNCFWFFLIPRDGRAVALKVCAQGYDGVDREIQMYQHANQDPNLKNLVVELLDHFNFAGRNGLHACLVFELMWTDVALFVGGQELWTIREIMLKEAIHQGLVILQALADNRIIHNGIPQHLPC